MIFSTSLSKPLPAFTTLLTQKTHREGLTEDEIRITSKWMLSTRIHSPTLSLSITDLPRISLPIFTTIETRMAQRTEDDDIADKTVALRCHLRTTFTILLPALVTLRGSSIRWQTWKGTWWLPCSASLAGCNNNLQSDDKQSRSNKDAKEIFNEDLFFSCRN